MTKVSLFPTMYQEVNINTLVRFSPNIVYADDSAKSIQTTPKTACDLLQAPPSPRFAIGFGLHHDLVKSTQC